MRRVRLGFDVFDAALRRMVESYEDGHTVVVSVSGGKDSGTCLELAIMAATMTDRLPVNACIQDEEVAYPGTYEYVERLARRPEVDFKWFVCHQPIVNVFNRAFPYFWCFDKELPPSAWVREPPDFAVENPEINIESIVHPRWFPVPPGKHIIDVVGLRVSESSKRMLGLVSSGGHLTKPNDFRCGVPYQKLRPIYDWTDADVWRAAKERGWDYNRAYDVMVRMGVPMRELRIGPPTLNVHSADKLRVAASAWPRWFDRVCKRLPGVRQAAQFGSLVARPRRRLDETWEQAYTRLCVDDAPADWIRKRAILLRDFQAERHARHSGEPLPQTHPCHECGGAGTACWRRMTEIMFNGDPFSMRLLSINKGLFPFMEPEFFRAGTGFWGGTPTW